METSHPRYHLPHDSSLLSVTPHMHTHNVSFTTQTYSSVHTQPYTVHTSSALFLSFHLSYSNFMTVR